jgi:hypothetical protein
MGPNRRVQRVLPRQCATLALLAFLTGCTLGEGEATDARAHAVPGNNTRDGLHRDSLDRADEFGGDTAEPATLIAVAAIS